MQRLSPHGLHWPTVDEGLDTAALTSVSLMLLGRRNATTGGSGNNLASISLLYTPRNEVVGGYTGFTMSVRPSVDKSYVVR